MLRIFLAVLFIAAQSIVFGQTSGSVPDFRSDSLSGNMEPVNAWLDSAKNAVQIDSVRIFLNKAIAFYKTNRRDKDLARTYQTAGVIYENRTLYDYSLENYFKALTLFEISNDSLAVANVLDDIGNIYLITKDLDQSLKYFMRSRKLYEALEYSPGLFTTRVGIGAVFQKKGDFDKALFNYQLALKDSDLPGFEDEKAILLGNIGSTYMQMDKPDSALTFLKKALALKEMHASSKSIAHTLNDLSEIMLELNRPEEAGNYARRAAEKAKAGNSANQLKYAYLNLSKSDKALNQYDSAYSNLVKYNHLNDSLFGIEKERLFKELRVKYETEKKDQAIKTLEKEKEIANLRKRVYLAIGIVILLVGIVLFNWQRMRAKRNRQLLEKEKEIDRMKTNFFANISHEFRTPLTLILSPLETMLEATSVKKQREQLGVMKKSANRLLQLINQILDLSKLEAGQLKIERQTFDIIELLRSTSLSFAPLMNAKHIRYDFSFSPDELWVVCDAAKVETIVINLISNAIKYTDTNGSVLINALFSHQSQLLELTITDTGRGIANEQIPYVFDRFYQSGSDTATTDISGTGIGLALTKQLVELLKGNIEVQSELGQGTRFSVRIPLETASAEAYNSERPVSGNAETLDRTLTDMDEIAQNQNIEEDGEARPILLLIEDNPDVRAYLKDILLDEYQILEAANGLEGLESAIQNIPDLVISDVMMPEMDGYEVCKRLKKDEKTSHIPVILLTAKTSVESRIAGLETEADMYLSKPFVPKELKVCVKNLIQSRRRLRKRYNRELYLKPSEISINSVDEQFLTRLMVVLEKNYSNIDFTVDQLGKEVGMSRSQIHRKLHALTNESSSRFIRSFRLQKAMGLLTKNAGTISEISFMVGFNSPSYFNKCFLEQYGHTPSSAIENSKI